MTSIPKPFQFLGYGGLVPFWALGLGALFVRTPDWAFVLLQAQIVYAATIVSFLGAVHWGLVLAELNRIETAEDERAYRANLPPGNTLDGRASAMLVYGIVPAVMAWLIVIGVPFLGLWWMWPMLMIGLLASAYLADIQARDAGILPAWYLRLRKHLTLGAQAALAVSLIATLPGGS